MQLLLEFGIPAGYQWLLDRGLVGFEPFSPLQPWHYLPYEQCFWVSERWPKQTDERILAFAKRQDCDDVACFLVSRTNKVDGIVLIEGWTENGYDILQKFPNFWAWLKHVVDDIENWIGETE